MKTLVTKGLLLVSVCCIWPNLSANAQPWDLQKDKVLYTVGYGHLDTQWNWDYQHVINICLPRTVTENLYLFGKYPDYQYNFTGSRRYKMIKEYYPDLFAQMKKYIDQNRWHLSGSSVDEGEANISSSESLMRQILYGNQYFRNEFGKETYDYMLPDCFGFVATLPSVLHHAGLLGFSTQKLTWKSAIGIPFNVGVWNGLDGKGVVAALNATKYTGRVEKRLDLDTAWLKRMDKNHQRYGMYFDYRYYGVGDQGGAPRENDVRNMQASLRNPDSKLHVYPCSSDQMFKDITPEIRSKLPVYQGDILLTDHSAGSMTSVAYMKRVNRKNEHLAQWTELTGTMAMHYTGKLYPSGKIYNAWDLILGSQMHDMLPGTSIPKAYEFCYNDEFLAANQLEKSGLDQLSSLSTVLNTQVAGRPIVVFNPVIKAREDIVTAKLDFGKFVQDLVVLDAQKRQVPAQITKREGNVVSFIFLAKVPAAGMAVFEVQPSSLTQRYTTGLMQTGNGIENEYYKIQFSPNGDIASVYDKKIRKELLEKPASLEFTYEKPQQYPSWNMDWEDRNKDAVDRMDQNAQIRLIESGPVRLTMQVKRSGRNSEITQLIRLSAGEAGKRVEIDNSIDWQSTEVALKANFTLSAYNPLATYNLGMGAIQRSNNDSLKYEVPSKLWFDLTDASGKFGVSILEDCKYGSDKPSDNTLRLTLMYTPGVRNRYLEQATQDWGIHEFKYGLYSHAGDWKQAETPWQAEFLNKPLVAFEAPKHGGSKSSLSFFSASSDQIGLMAFKKAEDSDYFIVRVNEMTGKDIKNVALNFDAPIEDAYEVNGQEQKIGSAKFSNKQITADFGYNGVRSFAVKLKAEKAPNCISQYPLSLPFNQDVFTTDHNCYDYDGSQNQNTLPAEEYPKALISEGINFVLGSTEVEAKNVVACKGQTLKIPAGYKKISILANAFAEDVTSEFTLGEQRIALKIPHFNQYLGQHYLRIFNNSRKVEKLTRPFLKTDNVAWYCSHVHNTHPSMNIPYSYCYIYKYDLVIPEGATTLVLPKNDRIKIYAITVYQPAGDDIHLTAPVFDRFDTASLPDIR